MICKISGGGKKRTADGRREDCNNGWKPGGRNPANVNGCSCADKKQEYMETWTTDNRPLIYKTCNKKKLV